MKKPLKLSVSQIRLFPVDMIGLQYFRAPSVTELIRKRYGFSIFPRPIGLFPDGLVVEAIGFTSGQFEHEGKKTLIESLSIEERRILFTIEGSSEIAHLFFDDLRQLLEKLDDREGKLPYQPLLLVQETTCVAQLSMPFAALLSENLLELQEELKKAASLPGTGVELFPLSVKFGIRYPSIPAELSRNKVVLADKEISIEIRAKTDPAEQIYFTHSPFSSDVHLRLIEDLERRFTTPSKK